VLLLGSIEWIFGHLGIRRRRSFPEYRGRRPARRVCCVAFTLRQPLDDLIIVSAVVATHCWQASVKATRFAVGSVPARSSPLNIRLHHAAAGPLFGVANTHRTAIRAAPLGNDWMRLRIDAAIHRPASR